ncbi:hypothetical protein FF100_13940 [Methylobacterium terricola]|uniref:Papain-like cysteine peptidase n=1 Tax=Methylobacterium terricola TaxID=2583531 RepID=A0A5C4LHD0_9HYPH|nr:hypothetical protein [Methylobacterium terricola]TNC12760.1 hypothetical protein FF100_13940 [Methylobacterium terricola]
MSAFGQRTAIISLGVSCQTAWQIDRHVDLLSSLTGEPLTRATGPFDWLIMPPRSFASWMRAGGRFPDHPREIVCHPNFYWPAHNLHFWHEFTRDDVIALDETFEATRAKFAYLLDRFAELKRFRRCLFFVSNTQANLDVVTRVSPSMDFHFSAEAMAALTQAVTDTLGLAGEIHFVTDRDGAGADPDPAVRLHRLDHPNPHVLGDDEAWAEVFRTALLPRTVLSRAAA